MKRALSLVLACSLVLGSIPAGFAATPTAGDTLKGYGLLAGDQNGNLNEDKEITRGEMMVVLARLLGKFDEAKAYSIPSTSKDVAGHWAASYIAFAEKEGWTSGKGNGMFDPNGKVTVQETAAFMMKSLGYTVTDFAKVVDEATKLGLLKDVNGDAAKAIVRADLFKAALNTINTPVKDSTQKLGEKLGVVKVEASALTPDDASAVSQNTIEVKLTAEAKAVNAADFSIVDKDGKALEVKGAALIDSKTVWLATADQTAGKIYTVKVAGKSYSVTGLQKDNALPEITKGESNVQDNQTVRLVFSKNLDPRNALVASNYTFNNGLTATSVVFEKNADGDDVRSVVLISTSAQDNAKVYKLTVGANVTDYYGNKVSTEDENNLYDFSGAKADTTAPRILNVTAKNGEKIRIEFEDKSDLSKDNALNIANYVFVDKTDSSKTVTAVSAKFILDGNNKNTIVELKTTAQIEKHAYELTISNVTDKFGNALTANKASFVGAALDTVGPTVDSVSVLSNTVLKVTFSEDVDSKTATDAANYKVDNDLAVTAAKVDSNNDNVIWLTTSSQKVGTTYKLTVSNVQDAYKNAIASGNTAHFSGKAVDSAKPKVTGATASYVSGEGTYVTVTFNEPVNETLAKVASNYYFGSTIGYGVKVTKVSDDTFKVKVNALSDGTTYTCRVSNVEDYAGNVVDYDYAEAKFVGKVSEDTAKAKLTTAYTVDKRTVKLIFDKAIVPAQLKTIGSYTVTDKSGKTLVATVTDATKQFTVAGINLTDYVAVTNTTGVKFDVASDNKSVTVRFNVDVFTNAADGSSQAFKVKATVTGVNGQALNSAYVEKSVYSSASAPELVKIDSVTSIDTTTVDIKFNQKIKLNTLTETSIQFVKASDSTTVQSVKATRLTDDKTVLRVAIGGDGLTKGAKYTVKLNGVAAGQITDSYGDLKLSTETADIEKVFYVSSNTNVEPSVSTYTNEGNGHLKLTISEEVTPDRSLMKIVDKNGNDCISTIDNSGKTVDVYFDTTNLVEGKTYTLLLSPGAIKDLSNKGNGDDIKVLFGVSSTTRDAVKIEGVTVAKTYVTANAAEGYTTLTVVFNKEINNLDVTDFDVTSGGAVLATTAYSLLDTNGDAITNSATDYYSVVLIRLNSPNVFALSTSSASNSVRVDFATAKNVNARDGAAVTTATASGAAVTIPTK